MGERRSGQVSREKGSSMACQLEHRRKCTRSLIWGQQGLYSPISVIACVMTIYMFISGHSVERISQSQG